MKLLPCPFCGDDSVYMEHNSTFSAYCAYCGCFGPTSQDESKAAELWNTRPAPQEQGETK